MKTAWEAINNRWNQTMLNYSRGQQLDVLRSLGVKSPTWEDLALLLTGALSALALLGAGWAWWDKHRVDPWARQMKQLRRELAALLQQQVAPFKPGWHLGQVVTRLQPLLDSPTLLMFAIMILVIVVGTAMDMTPTILILTPVLMPIVKAAGIDPVYFGVLFIMNNAIGLITPPVGTVLNVVAGVGRMSMSQVTRGVTPFMLAQLAVMFLLVLFPSIVMVPLRWLSG